MKTEALFSSLSEKWETPQELFDVLNDEFHFTVDVCALPENAKCERYYTPERDGLKQRWGGVAWCNPPYGRKVIGWVKKASQEAKDGNTVVMLLPARTDTQWFHKYVYEKPNVEIRFIEGRLRFGGSKYNAPFPSMICVFRPPEGGVK